MPLLRGVRWNFVTMVSVTKTRMMFIPEYRDDMCVHLDTVPALDRWAEMVKHCTAC